MYSPYMEKYLRHNVQYWVRQIEESMEVVALIFAKRACNQLPQFIVHKIFYYLKCMSGCLICQEHEFEKEQRKIARLEKRKKEMEAKGIRFTVKKKPWFCNEGWESPDDFEVVID